MYRLLIETDLDFSIKYLGVLYNEFTIIIWMEDPKMLNEIQILGPHGTELTQKTKFTEIARDLHLIKQNPEEYYSSLGGNRGCDWTPMM